MKYLYILIIAIITLSGVLNAQVPKPADPQTQPIMLRGATLHIGNGEVIEYGTITFDKGIITGVYKNTPDNESAYKVIDVRNHHIYPGFILTNSSVGIAEVSSIRAMRDSDEIGFFAPNTRSLIAYNTDSKIPATFRYNGVLAAETTPSGGRISGTSSVMYMDGWNWEDAVLKADNAIHLNWPGRLSRKFEQASYSYVYVSNKNYIQQKDEIKAFLRESIAYAELANKPINLKLQAMSGLFTGEQTLMIHINGSLEIIDAVTMARENGIEKIAVITGEASLDVIDFLKENKIPVILPSVHSLPSSDDIDVYLPFKLAKILTENGIKVTLSHSGSLASGRNLPFYAGTSAAFGMDKEEALKMITSNPAEMLGVGNEIGTLEKGKHATLFVSEGDALDMMGNVLTHAFIKGKKIILDNEQNMMFERYSKKYEK